MQNISLHIEYLLRTHDCVILPGIGAFLRTRRAALFHEDGSIEPPCVQICFNSSIVASDGLLAHSVGRRNKISFEEAAVMVSNAAEQCRNALSTTGEVAIGKLGLLTADNEGRISFRPYRSIFDSIWKPVLPVSETGADAKTDTNTKEETTAENRRYYNIRIPRRLVRYAAILTVCLLSATSILFPSANRTLTPEEQYASVVPVVEKITTPATNKSDNKETPVTDTPTTMSEEVVSPKHFLVVATFANETDCEKYIATREDTTGLQTVCNGKVCRVYSAASNSKDELQAIMSSNEHKQAYPQAWIWTDPTVD